MTKRKIAIAIAAAALAGTCAIGGTLAWLTATDAKTNSFTVGNVDVTVTETDEDGEYTVAPGVQTQKDPKITVTAKSVDSYVFVKVTNETNGLITPYEYFNETYTALGATNTQDGNWTYVTTDTDGSLIYVYTGEKANNGVVPTAQEATELDTIFEYVKLADTYVAPENSMTNEIDGDIIVKAYAIQAASFNTWQEAYEALQGTADSGLPALNN